MNLERCIRTQCKTCRFYNKCFKKKNEKKKKKRKSYNWEFEIARGNTDKFYNSTDFDIAREKVLARDKGKCQFF